MKKDDFIVSAPGKLISITGGHSFIPNPLPPKIKWSNKIVKLLGEARFSLGKLNAIEPEFTRPEPFIFSSIIKMEAVSSTRIEGTQTTFEDILIFESLRKNKATINDVLETYNYINATNYGYKELKEKKFPLCNRLIKETHRMLLDRVRGDEYTPGEFRRTQVYIGIRQQPIEQARFIPPPPNIIDKLMSDLENFLNSDSDLDPLLISSLSHYQFEAIHPFYDGNGRIGRILIIYILMDKGLLNKPILYISPYFERENREKYYNLLLKISQKGAWEEWIEFYLLGIIERTKWVIDTFQKSMSLIEEFEKSVIKECNSLHTKEALKILYGYPIFTTPLFHKIYKKHFNNVSLSTIRNILKIWQKLKIIEVLKKDKKEIIFYCPKLMNILTKP